MIGASIDTKGNQFTNILMKEKSLPPHIHDDFFTFSNENRIEQREEDWKPTEHPWCVSRRQNGKMFFIIKEITFKITSKSMQSSICLGSKF
jgi:hypothetical protein